MQADTTATKSPPHLTKTPPSPPPDKKQEQKTTTIPSTASDLDASREFAMSGDEGESESWNQGGPVAERGQLDSMKRDWYQQWLRDKKVEKGDPWGFSSTGVSRTASPARSARA